MRELIHDLGITPEVVERQLQATLGFGGIYASSAESKKEDLLPLLLAATNFRSAGAHSLLLGSEKEAHSHFARSAKLYLEAGYSYGAFVANLSLDEEPILPLRDEPNRPEDIFGLWSTASLSQELATDGEREVTGELDAQAGVRVGVLGIPVGVLLDLRRAALSWLGKGTLNAVLNPLNVLLTHYTEAFDRARSDKYHWRFLRMPFHPVEPDIIGVLVGLERVLTTAGGSVSDLIPQLIHSDDAESVLCNALLQLNAWSLE